MHDHSRIQLALGIDDVTCVSLSLSLSVYLFLYYSQKATHAQYTRRAWYNEAQSRPEPFQTATIQMFDSKFLNFSPFYKRRATQVG